MKTDLESFRPEKIWLAGCGERPGKIAIKNLMVKLSLVPALAIAGFCTWTALSDPGDAESGPADAPSPAMLSEQDNPAVTSTKTRGRRRTVRMDIVISRI